MELCQSILVEPNRVIPYLCSVHTEVPIDTTSQCADSTALPLLSKHFPRREKPGTPGPPDTTNRGALATRAESVFTRGGAGGAGGAVR